MAILLDPRQERKRLAGAYTPTDEEKHALQVISDHWNPDDPYKQALEQQWLTNIAFLKGFQYLTWDPVSRQLSFVRPPTLQWKARVTRNFIRPYVDNAVARVGSFRPKFKVRPASTDEEDEQAASVGEKVLDHYWGATRMPQKKWEHHYWLEVCGNSFIFVNFDAQAGDSILTQNQVNVGGSMIDVQDLEFEGDIVSYIRSPLNIYVDNNALCREDIRWLLDVDACPIEWVEEHFPDKAPFVQTGISNDPRIQRQRWVLDLAGPASSFRGGAFGMDKNNDKWCVRKQYWERPCPDYPKGRFIIECGGVVVRMGDNPTPKGKIPYIWSIGKVVPGQLWGQGTVDNLLSPQRSYNRNVSKKEEHIVKTANAKILEHRTNELDDSAWQSEIGEIIRWHGQVAPSYLEPPTMPPDTDNELQRCRQDFDLIAQQQGPGRGQYSGKISGKAYLALIEQDLQSQAPMIERLALDYGEWGSLVLEFAQMYLIEDRLIKVTGRGDQFDIVEFQGADLRGNTDVTIDVDSMMPKSKTMAMEQITAFFQAGLLSPLNPDDKARAFRMLGLEDEEGLIRSKRLDEREASLENKRMLMGLVVEPAQFYQDQDIHMLQHTSMMKTDEYKNAEPVIKMIIDAHVKSHVDIATPRVGVTVPPEDMMNMGGEEPGGESGGPPGQSKPKGQSQGRPSQPFT